MKHLTILATAILLSTGAVFAERGGFHDRTDNWLKNNSPETTGGGLRDSNDPWIPGGTNPGVTDPAVPRDTPIGSGLTVLVLSAAGYLLINRRRRS